jgi:serine/threonine-protein kinase PknK
LSSKRPVAPPPHIPGFTYVSLLGSGGFSDVYLYEQDRPRRKVAVKVLLSDLKTEGARRRFESEANLMAQLSSHPYIVTIFEAEVTDAGHSYLAMEYCSRPSLDIRYRRQRFSVDEVLAVGIQVASAVETAHRAGIAHRDIKPANILVTDYNRPALTDFGISGTLAGDTDDDAGMSIPWSPPEQFVDGPVDGVRVDVWALGATLYTLLAGRSPFVLPGTDNSQRELISRITNSPLPRLGRADVPESLERTLSTAMAKPAASRYSSAHAFALALQRIQAELNLSVTPFEVLEEAQEESHPDDGFEETRVRNVAAIDPERTGSAPTFPARTRPQGPDVGSPDAGSQGSPAGPENANPFGPQNGSVEGEWAHATMLRRSAPAAVDDGTVPDATVQRPGLHPAQTAMQPGPVAAPQLGHQSGSRGYRAEPEIDATISRPVAAPEPAPETPRDHGKRNLLLAFTGAAVLIVAIVVGIVLASSAPEPKVAETAHINKPPADALDNGTVPDVADLNGVLGANGRILFTWTNPQPKDGDSYKWRLTDFVTREPGPYQVAKETRAEVAPAPDRNITCIEVMIVRVDGAASPMEGPSGTCYTK